MYSLDSDTETSATSGTYTASDSYSDTTSRSSSTSSVDRTGTPERFRQHVHTTAVDMASDTRLARAEEELRAMEKQLPPQFEHLTPTEKLSTLTGLPSSVLEQPFLLPAHGNEWKSTLRTVMSLCQSNFLSSNFFDAEQKIEFQQKAGQMYRIAINKILKDLDVLSEEAQRRFYLSEDAALTILRESEWDIEQVADKVKLKKNMPLSEHPQLRSVFFSFLQTSELCTLRIANSHVSTSVEEHVLEQSVEFVTYMMAERYYSEPPPTAKKKADATVRDEEKQKKKKSKKDKHRGNFQFQRSNEAADVVSVPAGSKVTTVTVPQGMQFLSLLMAMKRSAHTDFMRQCFGRLGLDTDGLMDVTLVDPHGAVEEVVPSTEIPQGDGVDAQGTELWTPETVCPSSVRFVALQFPLPRAYAKSTGKRFQFRFRHLIISIPEAAASQPPYARRSYRGRRSSDSEDSDVGNPANPFLGVEHVTVFVSRAYDKLPRVFLGEDVYTPDMDTWGVMAHSFDPRSLIVSALPGPKSEHLDAMELPHLHGRWCRLAHLDVSGLPLTTFTRSDTDPESDTDSEGGGSGLSKIPHCLGQIIFPGNGSTLECIGNGEVYRFANFSKFELNSFTSLQKVPSRFLSCLEHLVDVDLSSPSVVEIGDWVLSRCPNLRTISLEGAASLTEVGANFASNCSALRQVTLPSAQGLTRIGEKTFSNCPLLKSLDLSLVPHLVRIPSDFCRCLVHCGARRTTSLHSSAHGGQEYYGGHYRPQLYSGPGPILSSAPWIGQDLPGHLPDGNHAPGFPQVRMRVLDLTPIQRDVIKRTPNFSSWKRDMESQGTCVIANMSHDQGVDGHQQFQLAHAGGGSPDHGLGVTPPGAVFLRNQPHDERYDVQMLVEPKKMKEKEKKRKDK